MSKLSIKIKLEPNPEIASAIDSTLLAYKESYNRVLDIGWPNIKNRINGTELHHKTYYKECELSKLPTALVCSARIRATETLKSIKTKNKTKKPLAKDIIPIRYNKCCMIIQLKENWVSFSTKDGRKKLNFNLPEYYKDKVNLKVKSSELFKDIKHNKYYLTIVVEVPNKKFTFKGKILGVDLGIKRPAVSSDNQFHGKPYWNTVGRRYFKARRSLQAKGTSAAKRRLRRISGKENRFRKDCDHVLSKRLVNLVEEGSTIVLEDLTKIRKNKYGKKFNRKLNTWSFYRLKSFLKYKAELRGCSVELINPRYTSQSCSKCGFISKSNRKSQSRFKCDSCNFELNADLNAARNIVLKYSSKLINFGKSEVNGVQSITPDIMSLTA